jgi:hypothetical protein
VALIIPFQSTDYTLVYLTGPVIFLLHHLETQFRIHDREGILNSTSVILLGTCAFTITSTNFSYLQKPLFLQNQFPALFILLICTTVLSFRETKNTIPENANQT